MMSCTQENQLKEFLDSKHVHYIYLTYGEAYSADKIPEYEYAFEKTLLESVLINIGDHQHHEIAMIVIPATRRIDLDSLKKILGNPHVQFVSRQQAQQWFPDNEIDFLLPLQEFHPKLRIFYSHEIFQLDEINFCLQNPSTRIKMPLKDFLVAAHPMKRIEVATFAKYKIEVAQVFPQAKRSALQTEEHCMLGYSLQSLSFTPAKLAGMAEWISRHFSECSVLIGDGIHRMTLEINGTPAQYTTNRALKMGRDVIDDNTDIFNRHQSECRFHLISTAELQKTLNYHFYHQCLIRLFNEDERFKASVMLFAREFVSNRFQQEPERLAYCIQLSCNYLLEEVAITALLLHQRVFVFVYPGALTIMQELSQGLHPDAPEEFKQLVSVNLRLKRR